MSIYFTGILVPIISFIFQVWPRIINRYFGIDTWRHLLLAEYVRKFGRIPDELTDKYITPSGHPGYPPLIVYLISIFPKDFAENYQFLFSPFIESINNFFIFFISYYITGNVLIALIAQVIETSIPVIVLEASNLSTRILSVFIFNISFVSMIISLNSFNLAWFIASFVFLTVLFYTHKFAVQAYFFFCLGFSVLDKNVFYILFFLVVFLSVYLFGGETYRHIFYEHTQILKFWIRNIDLRFAHQFRGVAKKIQDPDIVHKLFALSVQNPIVYLIGNNPWLLIWAAFFINSSYGILPIQSILSKSLIFSQLNQWVVISILVAMATMYVKQLRFLGEGNRYIEYSSAPLAIILASFAPNLLHQYGLLFLVIFSLILAVLVIGIIYIQVVVILKDKKRTVTTELLSIINHLNSYKGNVRIAMFPLQYGDALTYFLKGKVLTTYNNEGLKKLSDIYPLVKIPIKDLIKRFRLNFILINKNYVTIQEFKLSKFQIVKEASDLILIKV